MFFRPAPAQFPNDQSTFLKICEFARSGNIAGLQNLFSKGVSVGLHIKGVTPVMLLAQEGNATAMWLLINHFNASINHALEGAARGNHQGLVKTLLDEGAHILYAAQGYGFSGNLDSIDGILNSLLDYQIKETRDAALNYLARGGHLAKMKDLFARWPQQTLSDYQPVAAMQGLAYAGFDAEIDELFQGNWGLISPEIEGHAEAGRTDKVTALLQRGNGDLKFSAISGYIDGGFFAEAWQTHAEKTKAHPWFPDDYFVLGCFASVGQVEQIEKKLSPWPDFLTIGQTARGYCNNGDISHAEDLLTRNYPVNLLQMDIPHFSFRDAMSCIKSMSLGLHFSRYAHNEKILIRTLAFVNNDWIREKVLDDVSIHYGYTHDKQHRHEILEQAKDINHLMKADHLDFAQARERINRQVVIRP